MSADLAALQTRIGYAFRDPALLVTALTHTSYLPDHPDCGESNQRLEFLGDSVLQLIFSDTLFRLHPGEREGVLSKRRSALTKGATLAPLARELGLDAALRLGASEESTGGRHRAAAQEDTFEALVGALFLDSDFATVRRVVLALYGPLDGRLAAAETQDNPKGRLQERVQPLHGNHALRYDVLGIAGEDHARAYTVAVYLFDLPLGEGLGSSKKLAEESAARAALERLQAQPQLLTETKPA